MNDIERVLECLDRAEAAIRMIPTPPMTPKDTALRAVLEAQQLLKQLQEK